MHPPPVDLSLTPILVEVPFRGVTTAEAIHDEQRAARARSGSLVSLLRGAADGAARARRDFRRRSPKEVESAEADLRFLHEAIANNRRHSRARLAQHRWIPTINSAGRRSPVSFFECHSTASATRHRPTQMARSCITGVPPGMLRHRTGASRASHAAATVDRWHREGRLSGSAHARDVQRAHSRTGAARLTVKPFRGIVDLVPHGHTTLCLELACAHKRARRVCIRGSAARRLSTWDQRSRASHRAAPHFVQHIFRAQRTGPWQRQWSSDREQSTPSSSGSSDSRLARRQH